MQKEQKRFFQRQRRYKKQGREIAIHSNIWTGHAMANFTELIEEIDDQMMIEAMEDFEVSFYNHIDFSKRQCY